MDQYARILDVSPHAADEEIHRAYRKLASTHHPDLGGDKDEFQKIQHAYEQLLSLRGKAAREQRYYGAAAVARQRNDDLRAERLKKAAAAKNQEAERARQSEEDSSNGPATNREQRAQATRAAAERQRKQMRSFMTRKLPLQNATTMFIFINTLDIFMTYVLISLGAIEANPIANYFFRKFNFNGLIFFKLVIVASVCVIAQIIAASSVRKGKDLLNFGSLLVGAVVAYSCWLLIDKFPFL